MLAGASRSAAGRSSTSQQRAVYLGVSGCAGAALGASARLLDVYGSAPLSLIGAGLALWLTLAFVAGMLAPSPRLAVGGTAVFLACWLPGYYVTDALLLGVRVQTMWVPARPWVLALVPASLLIGVAAGRARDAGMLGDSALALPLVWSIVEGLWAFHRLSWAGATATLALLLAAALCVVAVETRRRPVRLAVTASAAALAAGPFAVVLLVFISHAR